MYNQYLQRTQIITLVTSYYQNNYVLRKLKINISSKRMTSGKKMKNSIKKRRVGTSHENKQKKNWLENTPLNI